MLDTYVVFDIFLKKLIHVLRPRKRIEKPPHADALIRNIMYFKTKPAQDPIIVIPKWHKIFDTTLYKK